MKVEKWASHTWKEKLEVLREKEKEVRFLVDSGATYTLLPKEVWQAIEQKSRREHAFVLVDGSEIKRKVSECYIILPQGEAHTSYLGGRMG